MQRCVWAEGCWALPALLRHGYTDPCTTATEDTQTCGLTERLLSLFYEEPQAALPTGVAC